MSAAGFIATRTLGWSPGVRMSWSAKWTWNPDTPGKRAGGRTDLGGEVGKRREVVAEDGRLAREAIARELHPVAGVAGEPDDDPFEVVGGDRDGEPCRSPPLERATGGELLTPPPASLRVPLGVPLRHGSSAASAVAGRADPGCATAYSRR